MTRLMSRKEFLKSLGIGTAALLCSGCGLDLREARAKGRRDIRGSITRNDAPSRPWKWSIEGFDYEGDGTTVQCRVCPNGCILEPGDRSICRSKVNIDGKLYSLTYGNPCAVNIDPVEKKPLNHFHPGSSIFSVATTGCNLRCLNCQNWEISQKRPEDVVHGELFPGELVEKVKRAGLSSIAYTYSEPVTFYEYVYDTARLAREEGIKNVIISNGYINRGPLERLASFLDGANINLKSFDDDTYRCLNGGRLAPILETFKTLHCLGVWFEMTTLVVPSYVDRPEMIKRMCAWILQELGPDYPLHFTRFHPAYKLTRLPHTPVSTLERLRELAMAEGIHYVYIGNVPAHEGGHTYCHNCGKMLIERKGYIINRFNVREGRCRFCDTRIPGRWS